MAENTVYAYIITSVDVAKPDTLDISGYQHSYWPGEILLLLENDTGGRHILEDEPFVVDELVTFKVTAVRVAKGEMIEDDGNHVVAFAPPYQRVLGYLQRGAARSVSIRETVTDFADELKRGITPEKMGIDDAAAEFIHEAIDAQVRLVR